MEHTSCPLEYKDTAVRRHGAWLTHHVKAQTGVVSNYSQAADGNVNEALAKAFCRVPKASPSENDLAIEISEMHHITAARSSIFFSRKDNGLSDCTMRRTS